jgi:hypothetical protein
MRRFWPLILLGAGLLLLIGGFVYDIVFAGIPYQDPPPDLIVSYNRHAHIASVLEWIGFILFLSSGVGGITQLVVRRFRMASHSSS